MWSLRWYRRLSLVWKLSLPLVTVLLIGMFLQATILSQLLNKSTLESTVNTATNLIEQYKTLRSYYSESVISKIQLSGSLSAGIDHKSKENEIPLPATMIMDLSSIFEKNHFGTQIRLYSSLPFPNRNSRVLDDFQKEAIEYLKVNPGGIFVREELESIPKRVRVAIADRMAAQSCVNCHNSHPQSPFKEWKLGDVRGVLEVEQNIETVAKANSSIAGFSWIMTFLTGAFLIVILTLLLNKLIRPIKDTTFAISKATHEIFDVSEALSTTATDLTESATRQASNFTETSVSLDSMSMMVRGNSLFAKQASDSSHNLLNLSQNAQTAMKELSSAMGDILEANQRIDKVVKIIEEIGDKTEIIDEIVFKTQLLSFNASVEAERAGEHGRGFAVVAQEVGNLAQVSGRAATEITKIVKMSIKESAEVATDNRDRVLRGNELATRTRDQLNVVFERLQDILDSVNQIALASNEQSENINQITENINQLSQVANLTSGNAEVTSDSSRHLSERSRQLLRMVDRLEDIMDGVKDQTGS